jgi:feruloyl esterase
LKLIADAVLRDCDGPDGLKDVLVMNTGACHFNPAALTCTGSKTDDCLTAGQVAALEKVVGGPKDSRGNAIYSDRPYAPGIAAPGWRMLKLGTSQTATPNSADVTLMLSGLKGFFMTPYDPNFYPMHFDFEKDTRRVEETAALQDPTATQLSTFIGRGGKLILYHGMADPFFSAGDTARYCEEPLNNNEAFGPGPSWARLFLFPE